MKNKKGAIFVVILLIAAALIVLIIIPLRHSLVTWGDENSLNRKLPLEITKLPALDLETISSYEEYKEFATRINNLVVILDKQENFNIPKLKLEHSDHNRILKFITEYGPLIKNYNEVIFSANNFSLYKTDSNLISFYTSSSRFAFELIIINAAVFYTPSYQTVGAIYRSSGLTQLAFKCPSCVKIALSTSHWTIRNSLVELSSIFAKEISENPEEIWESISIESLKEKRQISIDKGEKAITQIKNQTNSLINDFNYTQTKEDIENTTKNAINKAKNWLEKNI